MAAETREEEQLASWRAARFLELQLDLSHALVLAEMGVDWHELKRLLDAGCDLDLAVRILAPVDG